MSATESDLPFTCDYAKSGRSTCKSCKENISKDELRLGAMGTGPHGTKAPSWYHEKCFFDKVRVASTKDIHDFATLRSEDQEKIQAQITGAESDSRISIVLKHPPVEDFCVEYATSARSSCKECNEKLGKGDLRLGRKDSSGEDRFGKITYMYYHPDCFAGKIENFEFTYDIEDVSGYKDLKEDDQKMLQQKLKKSSKKRKSGDLFDDDGPSAKRTDLCDNHHSSDKSAFKAQTDHLWEVKDNLEKLTTKKDLQTLLQANGQETLPDDTKATLSDRVADMMLFGSVHACKKCEQGLLVYSADSNAYVCKGCKEKTSDPKRGGFNIPKELDKHAYISKFEFKPGRKRLQQVE